MSIPCHILVENHPAIVYASRNGVPEKVLSVLKPFVELFFEERETSGEHRDTPECLLAQVVVRFGFQFCEDDFSNLRIALRYASDVQFLYEIKLNGEIAIWQPTDEYRQNPSIGLSGCQLLSRELVS